MHGDLLRAAWRAPSLRGRVVLLAGTVVVLLSLTLLILIWVLRSSQVSLVAQSNKHLGAVLHSLANAYETRSDRSISLTGSEPGPPPAPPAFLPAPIPPPLSAPPPLALPPRSGPKARPLPGEAQLTALTARVLADETGIEGGYFRKGNPPLVGYAFPTHEGPGDPEALPARETPIIRNLAAAALRGAAVQQDQFYGTHDVVLFVAGPVCETVNCSGGPVAAAWLMQRIHGAETDRKRALLWSVFGFGTIASITIFLAFLVLRQVDRGTQAVLDRLGLMEADLNADWQPAPVGLAEFHRLTEGLDRLRVTLRNQFQKERELQARLRQNERLAAIGQLAAGVAHDLRNPLATIRLRAQMTQRKTGEEGVAQAAGVILTEVDRLDGIIERLLNFSRPIRLHRSEADLSALSRAAAVRWQSRHSALAFVYRGESQVRLITDSARMEQVIDNIVENAVQQATETRTAAPVITLECGHDGEEVWLEISDNAGGFSPEALENALEPFFTTRAKGTGLGLAISSDVVHALGGAIRLHNAGAGAAVRLEWMKQPVVLDV